MSFIRFRSVPHEGKTERWEVTTPAGVVIARVAWSTGWRRYALRPAFPTEWEEDCLREVATFLEEKTRAYKEAQR